MVVQLNIRSWKSVPTKKARTQKYKLYLIELLSIGLIFTQPCVWADAPLHECVHWTGGYYPEDVVDHALVTGSSGKRLYMHQENPELCSSPNDGDCKGKAYVIPGDRVSLGNICGDWAYIFLWVKAGRLEGRHFSGWVEKNRIQIIPANDKLLAKREQGRKNLMGGTLLPSTNDPFLLAIQKNELPVVEKMLASGAVTRINKECESIIYIAARYSDIHILQSLRKAGLDPNCTIHSQWSPLMSLASVDRALATLWLNEIPDPAAAAANWISMGVDVNEKDRSGKTALRMTLNKNNVDVARVLLEHGADVNNYFEEQSDLGKTTILMDAIGAYSMTMDPSMISLLLKHGADVNFRNEASPVGTIFDGCPSMVATGACGFTGQTALTAATESGYYTIVGLLLEHGADPDIPRLDGKTALDLATEQDYPKIAQLIRKFLQKKHGT